MWYYLVACVLILCHIISLWADSACSLSSANWLVLHACVPSCFQVFCRYLFFRWHNMVTLEQVCQKQPYMVTAKTSASSDTDTIARSSPAREMLQVIVHHIHFSLRTCPKEFWLWSQQSLMQQKGSLASQRWLKWVMQTQNMVIDMASPLDWWFNWITGVVTGQLSSLVSLLESLWVVILPWSFHASRFQGFLQMHVWKQAEYDCLLHFACLYITGVWRHSCCQKHSLLHLSLLQQLLSYNSLLCPTSTNFVL